MYYQYWSGKCEVVPPPPCLNKNTLKNRIQFREKTVRAMTSYSFCNLINITKLTVAAKWKRSDSSAALECGVVLVVDVVLVGHVKFFRSRLRRGLISELSGEVLSKFSLPECQLSTAAALGSLRLWRPPPPLPGTFFKPCQEIGHQQEKKRIYLAATEKCQDFSCPKSKYRGEFVKHPSRTGAAQQCDEIYCKDSRKLGHT
jgi:hypothetical protein